MPAIALAAALLAGGANGAGGQGLVTPSSDTVPENLLRIELRFARPLLHPLAMDHVRLLDGRGRPVEGTFLDLPLPGADGRAVTLLLHPGRVKTGVGANLALGRALHAGEDVTLVVDDPQLARPLRKNWHVVPGKDEPLLENARPGATPRAGSRRPISMTWGTSLSASGVSLVGIRGPDGERVPGVATLIAGETVWRFVPAAPWRGGPHAIVVHPRLEDVAGNRPCSAFEARGLGDVECPQAERPFDVAE